MKHNIVITSYHVTEKYVICEFDHDGISKIFHITLRTFVELLNEVGEIQIGQFLSDDTKVELFGEISTFDGLEQIKTTPFVFDVCNSYISVDALEKIVDKLLGETPVCFISNMTNAIAFLINDVKKEVAKIENEIHNQ